MRVVILVGCCFYVGYLIIFVSEIFEVMVFYMLFVDGVSI